MKLRLFVLFAVLGVLKDELSRKHLDKDYRL